MSTSNQTVRQTQLKELLAVCRRAYLITPMGQAHRQAYARLRRTAQHNLDAIAAQESRGEEITEAVLWRLLPYTDTPAHRAQGAWIHLAPAIQGDLRTWYSAAGWTRPDEWPAVARAIWQFVRRCIAAPDELETACRAFAALPYTKGFQTGMLTPILNALRPDQFHLINNKNRAALNYFTGSSFGPALVEYPAANAALHTFLAQQQTLADQAWELDMPAGDLFDLFCHWLVNIHRFAFRPVRYWRLTLDDEPGLWTAWQEGRYIALGWDELGDVSGIARREFDRRRDSLIAQYPSWTKTGANLVWRFARQIREGDQVLVATAAGDMLGHGTVTGAYYYVPEVEGGHRRPVEWADTVPRQAGLTGRRALQEVEPAQFEAAQQAPPAPPESAHGRSAQEDGEGAGVSAPQPALAEGRRAYHSTASVQPAYSLAQVAAATYLDAETLDQWLRALTRKGQAILYGPPGTGKTYVAQHLARHLAAQGDGFVESVQFHPAYSYEDFVQGIRPQVHQGALHYALQPGRFMRFCRRAAACRDCCVLIIDEINRADVAQVFGELLYLLEYREEQIVPAGDDTPFAIPANVRLIATMNTADRSLALVDHALRRRFAFLPLYPDLEVLRRYHAREASTLPVDALLSLLERINHAIGDRNQALGITYFLRPDLPAELANIWQLEIEPYLEEIFFDQPEQVESFRWANVRGALGL